MTARAGETASRLAHNQETVVAAPTPATNPLALPWLAKQMLITMLRYGRITKAQLTAMFPREDW